MSEYEVNKIILEWDLNPALVEARRVRDGVVWTRRGGPVVRFIGTDAELATMRRECPWETVLLAEVPEEREFFLRLGADKLAGCTRLHPLAGGAA